MLKSFFENFKRLPTNDFHFHLLKDAFFDWNIKIFVENILSSVFLNIPSLNEYYMYIKGNQKLSIYYLGSRDLKYPIHVHLLKTSSQYVNR